MCILPVVTYSSILVSLSVPRTDRRVTQVFPGDKYQTTQGRPLGKKYSCVYEFMTKLNMKPYIKTGVVFFTPSSHSS
jgi:hypothetical protein